MLPHLKKWPLSVRLAARIAFEEGSRQRAMLMKKQTGGLLSERIDQTLLPPGVSDEEWSNQHETGRHYDKFFGEVTRGEFGRSDVGYQPIMRHPHIAPFEAEYEKHRGFFDDHITKSIPSFKEIQMQKGHALTQAFSDREATLLDIGGSEGSWAKAIAAMTGGRLRTTVLDPSASMAQHFHSKSFVQGATHIPMAFLRGWKNEDKTSVPAYHSGVTADRYDIIHESMTFQFVSKDRLAHFSEVKRLLKPGGLFVTEEKLTNPQWDANEQFKDVHHKARYYNDADLQAKQKKVGFTQSAQETKAVGMVSNLVSVAEFEKLLLSLFKEVWQYWDSGNFKGYCASDNNKAVQAFLLNIGNTNTKFSTVKTPRRVKSSKQPQVESKLSDCFKHDNTPVADCFKAEKKVKGKGKQLIPFHISHVHHHM